MIAWRAEIVGAVMRRALARSMTLDHDVTPIDPAADEVRRAGQLYVHIPFCPSLCPFCTFHRVKFRESRAAPYFAAVRDEIDRYADAGFAFQDLYVGGGTPTVLPDALAGLIAHARSRFPLRHIAVETNPSHLTETVLELLRTAGVNRLSVGVQSFDDGLLERMGRSVYGTRSQIIAALEGVGRRFPTLNIDMMFNLPGQTDAILQRDLETVLSLTSVNQASFYPLMTSRGSLPQVRERMGPTTHREQAQYRRIRRALEPTMPRSSIWCFSSNPDSIDEYMAYHDDYAGVGSGAFSYLGGTLYSNTFSISRYVRRVSQGQSAATALHRLTITERMRFDLLIKLFGLELSKSSIEEKYGGRFRRSIMKEITALRAIGAITEDARSYRLTESGLYVWVVMMREFLNSLNTLREDMRSHLTKERDQDVRLLEILERAR